MRFHRSTKGIQAQAISFLPTADARTHATFVRLDLPPNLRDVFPGMFARAYFSVGRARKWVAPAAAVVKRSELTGVHVVSEKKR